jgi:HSP20 family protein
MLSHPVHTNFFDATQGIRYLHNIVDDPWYNSHLSNKLKTREGVTTPDFDAAETNIAYFLQGDFAGVASKDDIKIEWVGNRTLVIEATVEGVNLAELWGVPLSDIDTGNGDSQNGDSDHLQEKGHKNGAKQHAVRTWLSERGLGPMQRSFTFPRDVDAENLRAKLRNGVLLIMVPKMTSETAEESRKRVLIEE